MSKKKTAKPAKKKTPAKKTAKKKPAKKPVPIKKTVAAKPTAKKSVAKKTPAPAVTKKTPAPAVAKKTPAKTVAKKAPVAKPPAPPVAPPVAPAAAMPAPMAPPVAPAAAMPAPAAVPELSAPPQIPLGPPPSLTIIFPQGDTVPLVFNSTGISKAKSIAKVDITQNALPVPGVVSKVTQQADKITGGWIVEVAMPAGSAGDFEISVTDSDGASDTQPFSI